VYKDPRNLTSHPISKVFFDIEVKTFDIEGGKDPGIGASSISYTILLQGPSVPRLPSMDSKEDCEMDFDDPRDFMYQDIPAGGFPTVSADPGPIH
jgi:hypothetical protein